MIRINIKTKKVDFPIFGRVYSTKDKKSRWIYTTRIGNKLSFYLIDYNNDIISREFCVSEDTERKIFLEGDWILLPNK